MNRILFQKSKIIILQIFIGFYICACTLTGGSEVIDYQATKKTKPLDLPPELLQANTSKSKKDSVSFKEVNKEIERTSSGAVKVDVSIPTEATIVDNGIYRYLETDLDPSEIWDRLGEFLKETGLSVSVSNPEVGVIYTDWQENLSKNYTNAFRKYFGQFFGGLLSSGQLDRYQIFVEKRAGKTRIYLAHYGLHETNRPGIAESYYWTYRQREPILEMEILKRLAIFLGVAEAKINKSQNINIDYAKLSSNNTITINDNLDQVWQQFLLKIPNNGFILNSANRSNKTIDVMLKVSMNHRPYGDEKQFPPYKIFLEENQGVTSVKFTYIGEEKKLANKNIDESINKLVLALNTTFRN